MFTGLIEQTGTVKRMARKANSMILHVYCGAFAQGLKQGDSIAIDGMCLTVEENTGSTLAFTALDTSVIKTIAAHYKTGSAVNLEKSLTPESSMGGHAVYGHVDTIGRVMKTVNRGSRLTVDILIDKPFASMLVENDSIAVNGVSLTVKQVRAGKFTLDIIPETIKTTNICGLRPGMKVNIEINNATKALYAFNKRSY